MLALIVVIVVTSAVSISQPKAVRAVGRGVVCAITLGHAKCKAPAPAPPSATSPAEVK